MSKLHTYVLTAKWLAILIANYFGFKLAFAALNYKSDSTFVAGIFGVAFLLLTDAFLLASVERKLISKIKELENETD